MRLIWRSFNPSGPWWFAVSQPPARTSLWSCFEGMGAALWSWLLVGSESNVRHWGPLPAGAFRPSGPWRCAVSQPPARSLLWSRCPQARSVFAVSQPPARTLLWSTLRAWELHFGAGFLSVLLPFRLCFEKGVYVLVSCLNSHQQQQRSPGNLFLRLIWRSFRPSGPWCFAVSQPSARTSLWSCFEGMGAGSSSQYWMDWIGFDF